MTTSFTYAFPAAKFAATNTPEDQWFHAYTEYIEVMVELDDGEHEAAELERVDMLHSMETYWRTLPPRYVDGVYLSAMATFVDERANFEPWQRVCDEIAAVNPAANQRHADLHRMAATLWLREYFMRMEPEHNGYLLDSVIAKNRARGYYGKETA